MTTTANIGLTHIEPSQSQKEVTANENFDVIDKVAGGISTVAVTGGSKVLTLDEYAAAMIDLVGTLVSNLTVEFPAGLAKPWVVRNSTSGAFTVELEVLISGGPVALELDPGETMLVFSDGEGLYSFGSITAASTAPYDLGCSIIGSPTASEIVMRFVATRAVDFLAAIAGSQGSAGTAATAQTDFDLQKNGASVGTVRFAAAGTTASFIAASAIALVAGDVLSLVAPASPDATLANISITFAGAR
jgi:hypothetical protein